MPTSTTDTGRPLGGTYWRGLYTAPVSKSDPFGVCIVSKWRWQYDGSGKWRYQDGANRVLSAVFPSREACEAAVKVIYGYD